jgi:hypothetical protein
VRVIAVEPESSWRYGWAELALFLKFPLTPRTTYSNLHSLRIERIELFTFLDNRVFVLADQRIGQEKESAPDLVDAVPFPLPPAELEYTRYKEYDLGIIPHITSCDKNDKYNSCIDTLEPAHLVEMYLRKWRESKTALSLSLQYAAPLL